MGSNKVTLGTNDLKTWCIKNNKENLLGEWDYTRNVEASPETVAYGSEKKNGGNVLMDIAMMQELIIECMAKGALIVRVLKPLRDIMI